MKYILSIEVSQNHSAYKWAKEQSDSVEVTGHIGTHIDCYTKVPNLSVYEVPAVFYDCRESMPNEKNIENLQIEGAALILYTGILNKVGYGGKEYGDAYSFFKEVVLDKILSKKPKFIIIDACGIGRHGLEHISFDKKSEAHNCFVIENVCITDEIFNTVDKIQISIDIESKSTGKRCQVYGLD
jgi:kynurenine formamidase